MMEVDCIATALEKGGKGRRSKSIMWRSTVLQDGIISSAPE